MLNPCSGAKVQSFFSQHCVESLFWGHSVESLFQGHSSVLILRLHFILGSHHWVLVLGPESWILVLGPESWSDVEAVESFLTNLTYKNICNATKLENVFRCRCSHVTMYEPAYTDVTTRYVFSRSLSYTSLSSCLVLTLCNPHLLPTRANVSVFYAVSGEWPSFVSRAVPALQDIWIRTFFFYPTVSPLRTEANSELNKNSGAFSKVSLNWSDN